MLIILSLIIMCIFTGALWYAFFTHRDKRLLNRLQKMADDAAAGTL